MEEKAERAEKPVRRPLLRYILRYRWQYAGGILCLLVVDFFSLYIPQITGEITDGLTAGTMHLREIGFKVLLMLLTALVMSVMRLGWRVLLFGTSRKVERDIRGDLFTRLSSLSTKFYQQNKTGDLMAHFTNDMDAIRQAVGPAILTAADAVVMTVLVLGKMILYVDLKLTLLSMIPLLVILIGGPTYGKSVRRRFGKKQAAFSALTDRVEESLSGIRIVKAFVQEKHEMEAFDAVSRKNREANMDVVRLRAVVLPLVDGLVGLATTITLFYGGWLVYSGGISLGRFVAFNSYVTTLAWPMMAAGEAITMVSQGIASWKRVRSLLEEKPEIHDDSLTDHTISQLDGSIRFENLCFRYDPALPEVLHGFSVKISPGSTVGILGKTGCGKTTLVNLLLRLYDVPPGTVYVGGHDIRTIPTGVLRENIACVPQDNFLFSDTLQANIAFGTRTADQLPLPEQGHIRIFISRAEAEAAWKEQDPGAQSETVDTACNDLDAVVAASQAACLHENVMEFPGKYGTVVGERGVTLSGGQKQRAAIARALMKNAEILILDDALSAVDTDTERQILENLHDLRRGRTTILIAHRVSTVQLADQILVLENGRCAEAGTHRQLLQLGGRYAALYEQQQLEMQLQARKEAFHAED